MTSPLLVNLGTTLTVPLAFASDAVNPYATHFRCSPPPPLSRTLSHTITLSRTHSPTRWAPDGCDTVEWDGRFKWQYVVGAMMVTSAFLCVSIGEEVEKSRCVSAPCRVVRCPKPETRNPKS